MRSWNSFALEITYRVLGWIALFSESSRFYPQIIHNFSSRGNLDMTFPTLNLSKHIADVIYNASLFFSPVVQWQYFNKCGFGEMIPVDEKEVAFSIHAVLLSLVTWCHVFIISKRESNHISREILHIFLKATTAITLIVWISAAVCVFLALPNRSWLWLISVFNKIQIIMAIIEYIPQAVMNFEHKRAEGLSIFGVLLVLTKTGANLAQMTVQAIDHGFWANFSRNIGKTLASLVSMAFAILFVVQRYVLYPSRNDGGENTAPLLRGLLRA